MGGLVAGGISTGDMRHPHTKAGGDSLMIKPGDHFYERMEFYREFAHF